MIVATVDAIAPLLMIAEVAVIDAKRARNRTFE